MSKNPAEAAPKLLQAITTAQAVMSELHPTRQSEEREALKRSVLLMRTVYAQLMRGTSLSQPTGCKSCQ